VDDAGRYQLRLGDLLAFDARMRATLDCTSGWYAWQDWSGVPVSALTAPWWWQPPFPVT
jgi:hypothetical protein